MFLLIHLSTFYSQVVYLSHKETIGFSLREIFYSLAQEEQNFILLHMAGHNKWSKIKHKKAASDAKKSQVFSKIVRLIQVEAKAAKGDVNSPRLKAAIEKAKAVNMPKENIERAIRKASEVGDTKEVVFEAYGPGGIGIIIVGLTDNNNRTSAEIKHILSKHGASLGTPGSVSWNFTKQPDQSWVPNTTMSVSEEDEEKLMKLLEALDDHDDVQELYTNLADEAE